MVATNWWGSQTTATADDATPDVSGVRSLITANANATTITNFDNGIPGQHLTLIVNDANTTIDHQGSGPIRTNSAADITCSSGDVYEFVLHGTVWREIKATVAS